MRASRNEGERGDGVSPSPRPPGGAVAVAVRALSKRYGGVQALDGAGLAVEAGTVHAVVGENGAGKSTLMKILAGAVHPDAGTIELAGGPVTIDSPRAARSHGIGIVYQELSIFPHRSVLANLFVGREPRRLGLISKRAMRHEARDVLRQIGLDVDLDSACGDLPIGDRQLVEISRVLLEEPQLLILDEPNSALSERETQRLFEVLKRLRGGGMTMLYVSHRLEEVFQIADRITVLRNGRDVLTAARGDLSMPQVIEAMVGRHEGELFPPPIEASPNPATLVVEGLSVGRALSDVSFEARSGEIVGLAGLDGSGVSALLGALFGTRRATAGGVVFPDGRGLASGATRAARRGVSLVPADRRKHGLMLAKSVATNVAHVRVGALRRRSPWISRDELRRSAARQVGALHIRTPSVWAPVAQLSGGNQQKVVIGKWLEVAPSVVLLDDPTRGVDVGAKREIYQLIRNLSAEGRIVVFRSTELPELIGLSDRILVLYRGRLVGELAGRDTDSRMLLHAVNTGEIGRET
jgi:ABC-type sugar transport system ATPase subunit